MTNYGRAMNLTRRFLTASQLKFLSWIAISTVMFMSMVPGRLQDVVPSDSMRHGLAFVVLTMLLPSAWPRIPIWKWAISLVALGGFIEIAQGLAKLGRTASLSDWLVDVGAVGLTLWPAVAMRKFRLDFRDTEID